MSHFYFKNTVGTIKNYSVLLGKESFRLDALHSLQLLKFTNKRFSLAFFVLSSIFFALSFFLHRNKSELWLVSLFALVALGCFCITIFYKKKMYLLVVCLYNCDEFTVRVPNKLKEDAKFFVSQVYKQKRNYENMIQHEEKNIAV